MVEPGADDELPGGRSDDFRPLRRADCVPLSAAEDGVGAALALPSLLPGGPRRRARS